MLTRIGDVMVQCGIDDLVMRNMRTAHGLALEGMESAILKDIRQRHLALYAEYAEGECDSTSGVVFADDVVVQGDFLIETPEDF